MYIYCLVYQIEMDVMFKCCFRASSLVHWRSLLARGSLWNLFFDLRTAGYGFCWQGGIGSPHSKNPYPAVQELCHLSTVDALCAMQIHSHERERLSSSNASIIVPLKHNCSWPAALWYRKSCRSLIIDAVKADVAVVNVLNCPEGKRL